MKTQTTTTVSIYVGTYAKYNNGDISGEWVNLSDYSDAEELLARFAKIHEDESDPEYMIQDKDGEACILSMIGESMSVDEWGTVFEKLAEIEDSHLDIEVISAYCAGFGYNLADVDISDIEDDYSGSYDSDEDFAEDMADQLGYEIPNQWPFRCIDWEWAARELMYDYTEQNGHYFRNL
jgi:antirestriction protein